MAGLSVAGLTALAGLAVLPRTTTDMDGAEFALIAAKGGIAHPPGYPLYSAMLRLWHETFARWFAVPPEITSPATLSLLSVLLSAITAWVLWDAIMRWQERPGREQYRTGSGPWCVAAAVLAVMLATPVWRASTGIEPFALNNLMAACLILVAARSLTSRPVREQRQVRTTAFFTGLLFGLAFCNHHSLAFAVPMALPALGVTRRGAVRDALPGAAAGFIAGLIPIVWFVIQRDNHSGLVWGDWDDFLARLDTHLFRRDYGTLNLKTGAAGGWWDGPLYLTSVYGKGLTWIWSAVALAGLISSLRGLASGQKDRTLTLEALAVASFLTTGLFMPALFRLQPAPDAAEIMERFAALPLLFVAIPAASLLYRAGSLVDTTVSGANARKLFLAACAAAVTFQGANQFQHSDRGRESIADTHIKASVAAIGQSGPQGTAGRSWIVTNSDLDFFGFTYWTADMTPRPIVIQTGLWTSLWYRKKVLADLLRNAVILDQALMTQLEQHIPESLAFDALTRILQEAARTDAVFLSQGTFPGVEKLLEVTYPLASFIRVMDPSPQSSATQPSHGEIVDANANWSAPLMKALAGNPCRTAWECYALDGWRRTWTALEASSRAAGDQSQLKICADHLRALETGTGI